MKPTIGISIGDLNGIGAEILCKAFEDDRFLEWCTPVIFGSNQVLNAHAKNVLENKVSFNAIQDLASINTEKINVLQCWNEEVVLNLGVETKEGGAYAVVALKAACQALKDNTIQGLVTMPINKSNTQGSNFQYTGHTPFLKEFFGAKEVAMLMVADELKIALLTEHLPLADVSKNITKEAIKAKVEILQQSLKKDFGIDQAKIAVLGLNPHAGDGGVIGKEEQEIIQPVIEELFGKKNSIFGPYAADGFFARRNDQKFDVVLAMYHDQGLIPFKALDLSRGVNYTAGLNVVRTSPDHGTAYEIVGKNCAETESFIESLFTCIDIINARQGNASRTANPLRRGQTMAPPKKNKPRETPAA
jgi:4-hydroxythreonine-4-phosphate dehydrogenase